MSVDLNEVNPQELTFEAWEGEIAGGQIVSLMWMELYLLCLVLKHGAYTKEDVHFITRGYQVSDFATVFNALKLGLDAGLGQSRQQRRHK